MSREYTQFVGDKEKALLDALADKNSSVDSYRQSMSQLGECLGSVVLSQIANNTDSATLLVQQKMQTFSQEEYLAN